MVSITDIAYTIANGMGGHFRHYWILLSFPYLLYLALSVRMYVKSKDSDSPAGTRFYIFYLLFLIFLFRWPFLLFGQQNPDEGLEVASAITLLSDPIYWRSVAVPTHGPLTTYPLLLPNLIGFKIDFGAAKLVAMGMLAFSTLSLYGFARNILNETHARIALIPVVTFVCLIRYSDFVAYNAEYPVILLLCFGLYLLSSILKRNGWKQKVLYVLAGFVIACIPFAKIQGSPLAVALFLSGLYLIFFLPSFRRDKIISGLCFMFGCLIVPVLIFAYLSKYDIVDEFLNIYFWGQFRYATVSVINVSDSMKNFIDGFLTSNYHSHFFIILMMILISVTCFLFLYGKVLSSKKNTKSLILRSPFGLPGDSFSRHWKWTLVSLFLLVSAGVAAVYIPGYGWSHYFLLLIFPLGVSAGVFFQYILHNIKSWKFLYLAFFLTCSVLGPLMRGGLIINGDRFIEAAQSSYFETYNGTIVTRIKKYAAGKTNAAIWGWEHQYYVAANLAMATRTPPEHIIVPKFSEMRDYFVSSYANELEASKPDLFIDAVAPGRFWMDDKDIYGFHLFPEIRNVVERYYLPVDSVNGVVIYLRRES